jgi:L-asparaginase
MAARRRLCVVDAGGTIAQVRGSASLSYDENAEPLAFLTGEERGVLERLGVIDAVHLFAKDSTVIEPSDWSLIAQSISDRMDRFDGFVVTHGTDSLAYTSSVLSWMLGPVGKPVVVTGAQIPMRDDASYGRTDGWANLVSSVVVASQGRVQEVVVVFGSRILRGNRATKGNVVELDAFESPNFRDLGRVGKEVVYHPAYTAPRFALDGRSIPKVWPRVLFVKAVPGLDQTWLTRALADGVDGCVLETFASGSVPPGVVHAVQRSDIPCLLCLPGATGAADAFYYEPLYWLEGGLIVSGRDMTREAAYCKLMWALADSRNRESVHALLKADLAGEMQTEALPSHTEIV